MPQIAANISKTSKNNTRYESRLNKEAKYSTGVKFYSSTNDLRYPSNSRSTYEIPPVHQSANFGVQSQISTNNSNHENTLKSLTA